MTAEELERVTRFLQALTKASVEFGIVLEAIDPYIAVKGHVGSDHTEWVGVLGRNYEEGEFVEYILDVSPR